MSSVVIKTKSSHSLVSDAPMIWGVVSEYSLTLTPLDTVKVMCAGVGPSKLFLVNVVCNDDQGGLSWYVSSHEPNGSATVILHNLLSAPREIKLRWY